ncbi:MAG: hypothetical protein IJZ80_02260 [Clostridia bacterium]|nr:hypothetical protein [Clostridia bacterium]
MKSNSIKVIQQKMDQYRSVMFDAERYIWTHPQTGFKEWDTHRYLKDKFTDMGFSPIEAGDIPGFYFDIDTGREGPILAIFGEMDALPIPEHPECDKTTGAVHSCGHHCQSSALLGVAGVLSDPDILSELCGKIRICAVPAEELVEMEDREHMREEGKLKYLSGKSEFMRRGYLDDIDIALMFHSASGENPSMLIGPGMNGSINKRITLYGKKHVTGADPGNGINVLYAAQTAMSAVNALREVFPDNYHVRVSSVIEDCGMRVGFIPAEVVVAISARACDYAVLKDLNEKINRAYTGVATAFGAQIKIEERQLYIPENDSANPEFMQVAYDVGCEMLGEEHVRMSLHISDKNNGATDMGNVGAVVPCIHPYVRGGTYGGIHSPRFVVQNPEYAVYNPAAIQVGIAVKLLGNNAEKAREIISKYKPIYSSFAEYCEEMDNFYFGKKGIDYTDGCAATLTWG